MEDTVKLYYIVDTHGNYYMETSGQGLAAVRSRTAADNFALCFANDVRWDG